MNVRSLILTTAATASALACLASPVMAQGDWGRSGGPDRPDYGQDSRPTYAPAPQPGYDQGQPGGYDRGQPGGYDRPGYDRPQPGGPDRDQGRDDIGGRERGLQGWIQRGAQEGWLNGWAARKAFGTLDQIRHQEAGMRWRSGGHLRGDQRFLLNQQLNDLTRFVRSMHDRGASDHRNG
jgi:hypothetical protein